MAKQHIIKSVFWLTVSEIIYNISGYVIHSGVGRILGPSDYGRYGLIITLTTMIIILIGNGIPTAMSKFLSEIFETKPQMIQIIKRKALFLQCILIGSITLIFFLLAPLTAKALGDTSLTPLFRISTLIIPSFAAASFYFYYFTGIHKFNIQAILKTIRSLSRMFFILILAWLFRVEGSIFGYVLAPLLVFLIAFGIDKFFISPKIKESVSKASALPQEFHWQKLVNYAWPMTLFLLFYEIMISIDLYMIKGILNDDFLTGIYNGALTVARIPYFLFYALTIVLLPTISKTTSEKNDAETKSVLSQTLRLMFLLLFPIIALMSAFSASIITFFYGSDFAPAASAMQILVVGMSFLTIFYVLSFAINGAGKVKVPMWIAFFGMTINIILNYFLISKFGLLGASSATSITSLFVMLLGIYFTKKEFGVSVNMNSFAKIILSSIIIFFLSTFFPQSQFMFIAYSVILLVIYFTLLYMFKELNQKDLGIIKKLLRK
ncbi:MAG: flippase [Candidatus Moranbacteria bacterium]|nr:flippase [Candidatus Moranbacteria bacterium]